MSGLKHPLTVGRGTALMLNIVVGAGVLALPGLAIQLAGDHAFLGWLICVGTSLPLLTVFVILGKRYPNAGGISHYAQMAFGNRGYLTGAFLLLGAVVFGLPSIALTGGHYLALIVDIHPAAAAALLLGLATLIHLFPSELVSKTNAILAAVIVLAVTTLAVFGLLRLDTITAQPGQVFPSNWDLSLALTPFMMIFFAFTGWEMAANTSEEFRNPQRDFPISMYLTFSIVVFLYLSIAYISQAAPFQTGFETAFGGIAFNMFGRPGLIGTALLAALIVWANLAGALWAVSRLLYSLSREHYLPHQFQHSLGGTPWLAVLTSSVFISIMIAANALKVFELNFMLALAGQNFLILYGLASCALFRLSKSWGEKIIAATGAAIIGLLVILQGVAILYPLLILGLAFVVAIAKGRPDMERQQPIT